MKPKRIVLAGGSGFIGQLLIAHWQNEPIDIVVLSRKHYPDHGRVRYVAWDGETLGEWVRELDQDVPHSVRKVVLRMAIVLGREVVYCLF